MQRPERSTYTPQDFLSWRETNTLVLAPKFQRRGVWTLPARSFLIDTLIRGFPVPPIYMRVIQDPKRNRMIREIVDGQQRISAVLDFLDEKFALARSLNAEWAGAHFSDLNPDQKSAIQTYGFICEVLHGVSDSKVLEIFARLNTYSVKLNAQELRNGTYFGMFKQCAYSLAHEHIEFWRRHRIFGERPIARMLEVEFTSELLILQLDGLQDKKATINDFYEKYDETFDDRDQVEKRFRQTLDEIDRSLGDDLKQSEFRRPPLFYSLFAATNHRMFGIPKQKLQTTNRRRLPQQDREGLLQAITELSEIIRRAREDEDVPSTHRRFVDACLRQTDNIRPRQTRLTTLFNRAFR